MDILTPATLRVLDKVRIWLLGFLLVPGVRLVAEEATGRTHEFGTGAGLRNIALYVVAAFVMTVLFRPLGHIWADGAMPQHEGASEGEPRSLTMPRSLLFVDKFRTLFFWFFAIPGIRFVVREMTVGARSGQEHTFLNIALYALVATVGTIVYRPMTHDVRR